MAPTESDTAERRREHALGLAFRLLNRRERTVAEVRGKLAQEDVDEETAEAVVATLLEDGYLDDARYARVFAEDRRRLDGWGAERIERRLRQLGIAREHVEAAVGEQDLEQELEAAVALLERRFPRVPETPRERDRALGVLVRRGYELELAHDAIRVQAERRSA